MKTFVVSVVVVLVLLLIYEFLCDNIKISNFMRFAFSILITLTITMSFLNMLFSSDYHIFNGKTRLEESQTFAREVEAVEGLIKSEIEFSLGHQSTVNISYSLNEGKIVYEKIKVTILEECDSTKVASIVKTYADCEVVVNGETF